MNNLISEALKQNDDAVRLVLHVGQVLSVPGGDIRDTAWVGLVEYSSNPFFQQHHQSLLPVIQQMLIDQQSGVLLATGTAHQKTLAFVLRDSLVTLIIHCAHLIGGYAWATEIAPQVRTQLHRETLEDFLVRLSESHDE